MSEDLFARKVRGRVVTVYCRSCQAAIHVDGTEGEATIVKASGDLPTMPSTGPEPSPLESAHDQGFADADIGARVSAPPPLPKRKQEPKAEPRELVDEPPVWVVSGTDDIDHEFSDAQLRSALIRGQFDGNAIAWREGQADWLPIASIPELQSFLKGAGPGALAPPRPSRFGTQKAAAPFASKSPTLRPPSIEGVEPASIVVLKDEAAASLPPSSAHAALEALSQVKLEESGLALPPSSANAAEEALAETLPDDEVMSVHNPPILRAEDDIPVETLADDDVKSVHQPILALFEEPAARPESDPKPEEAATPSPLARRVIEITADKADVRGSDPFVLVDLEADRPKRAFDVPMLLDEATPIKRPLGVPILEDDGAPVSSVPPMRGKSRAGLWITGALLLAIGGGWFLLGNPAKTESERSAMLERGEVASPTKRESPSAEDPTPLPLGDETPAPSDPTEGDRLAAKTVAGTSRGATRSTKGPAGEARPQGERRPKKGTEPPVDSEPLPEAKPPAEKPEPATKKPSATSEPPPEPEAEPAAEPEAKPEPPPFDKAAAQSALAAAAAQAGTCRRGSDPPGTTSVTIIIAPSGRVTSASVAGPPYAGTQTGGCVAQRMRSLRVPAFSGQHQTVQKTVVVR